MTTSTNMFVLILRKMPNYCNIPFTTINELGSPLTNVQLKLQICFDTYTSIGNGEDTQQATNMKLLRCIWIGNAMSLEFYGISAFARRKLQRREWTQQFEVNYNPDNIIWIAVFFGLSPSSGILETRKRSTSEIGSTSVARWTEEDTYSVGFLSPSHFACLGVELAFGL